MGTRDVEPRLNTLTSSTMHNIDIENANKMSKKSRQIVTESRAVPDREGAVLAVPGRTLVISLQHTPNIGERRGESTDDGFVRLCQ